MNEKKMVSVILPVRNGEFDLLKKAVKSILNQTYPHFEVLLIDDGSGEEFSLCMRSIADYDERLKYFRLEGVGVSAARNYGIDHANGEYITFLDGDDLLCRTCFEEAVTYMEREGVDAVFGGTRYVYAADRASEEEKFWKDTKEAYSFDEMSQKRVVLSKERIHLTRAESVGEPYRFENGGYINRGIAARFIRASFFENGKNRFFEEYHFYEDAIWNICMIQSGTIHYVLTEWYLYFENPKSVSNRFNKEVVSYMEEPLEKLRGLMDLSDVAEYRAYTSVLMDSLRYVYRCLLGHPDWDAEKGEKKSLKVHLMKDEPWIEIARKKYRENADKRDRFKAVLYRFGLLFLYWRLMG